MDELYKRVFELEGISTCPHGRPISIKLTKYQIEKMFGRIV
jgi:DNA mismatch repair protein MutL